MARQDGGITARSLVLDSFKPQVAVLCSPAAQGLCEKNNLQFTQLVHPFSTLTTDLSWQEPYGQHVSPKGLRIYPIDLSSWKPPEQNGQKNKRILNSVVSQSVPPLPLSLAEEIDGLFQLQQFTGRSRKYAVQVPKSSLWFEKWRETFLKFHSEQQQSQHEFLNQFIACVLVIAASEVKSSEDISTILGKLSKLQLQHQREWPQTWFLPSILKFYLILHDNSSDNPTSSEGSYQSLRTTYGANFCYMLRLNSRGLDDDEEEAVSDIWSDTLNNENRVDDITQDSDADFDEVQAVRQEEPFHPLSPSSEFPPKMQTPNGELNCTINNTNSTIVRGKHLTQQDLQNIQIAINEFIGKSLLPYVERQAKVMHESILNRRGMSKSFFSATKRLFGTGAKTASTIVYSLESQEILSRKLADLYFLFGHYSGAYQLYHQIKKDFQADAAWIYYASSLEMAALSHFMMTQSQPPMAVTRSFPVHYITEAINNYIDLCRMPDAATRCAIICCECLKQMGNFGEAAAIFIRMTSEDCDLRSALMLEQAAYSFVKLNSPRKYAFHSVLAGHRYAKAGLRTHSLNCYLQSCQVYAGRGWRFAEDHIQLTITRHQTCLQLYTEMTKKLLSLLKTPNFQSVPQVTQTKIPDKKIPDNIIKVEHSHLKKLSSRITVNLLKVQNVTKEKTIIVEDIIFEPQIVVIENMTWGGISAMQSCSEIQGKGKSLALQLEPAQSCNIIFHTRALAVGDNNYEDRSGEHEQKFIKLKVKWRQVKDKILPTGTSNNSDNVDNKAEDLKDVPQFYTVQVARADIVSSSSSSSSDSSIVFQLRHVTRRSHDFDKFPCYVCPVELVLSHPHQKPGKLILKIEKDSKQSPEAGTQNSLTSSSQAVYFVGKTTWILDRIVDGQKLTYNVAVTRPGIYNIAPTISVKRPDDGTQQVYDLHSPFIIDQA